MTRLYTLFYGPALRCPSCGSSAPAREPGASAWYTERAAVATFSDTVTLLDALIECPWCDRSFKAPTGAVAVLSRPIRDAGEDWPTLAFEYPPAHPQDDEENEDDPE